MTGQPVGGVPVQAFPAARSETRLLVPAPMFIAPVVAAVAGLGTPLITSVATSFPVSPGSARWTPTVAPVGIGAMAITTLTGLALARRRSSETNP